MLSVAIAIQALGTIVAEEAKLVNLRVGQILTQKCPGVIEQDLIDKDIKAELSPLYRGAGKDSAQLRVEGAQFNTTTITFPGCYLLKTKLRVKKALHNPYAEVYLNMGGDVACREPEARPLRDEYCRNKTAPLSEFCPPSDNVDMRRNSPDFSQSCRLCDMCSHVTGGSRNEDVKKYFNFVGGPLSPDCHWGDISQEKSLTFRLCTPSPSELEEEAKKRKKESVLAEWDKYGEFLRGGSIIVSVHLAERPDVRSRLRSCDLACDRHEDMRRRGLPPAILAHLEKNVLRTSCVPRDVYVGCFYSLIKFTTEGLLD